MYTDEKAFTAADVVSANFFEIGKVFVEEGVVGGGVGECYLSDIFWDRIPFLEVSDLNLLSQIELRMLT